MTVASLAYAHQTQPWDAPLSFGVQAFIEFNGYILNDRHQADRIRVTNITGLDDADSTDSREGIPGDHEEIAYDAFYRGRTLVMSGEIQAGSLGVLKRLERDLKAALAPLVESPLKFRWFDVYDSFDDSQTLANYTAVIGSSALSSLTVAGGVLRWGTTQNVLLMRSADNRIWGDEQTTIRVVIGSTSNASTVYVVSSLSDVNDYLKVAYNAGSGSPTLTISTIVGGASNQLASTALSGIVQGQSVWLRSRVEGDLVTAEVWTTPPTTSSLPQFSTTAWLTGSDADTFGDQTLSQVGFGAQTVDTNWAIDDFRVESLCPGDVVFPARKLPNGLSIKDSQDSMTRFKRVWQATLRTSKSFAQCATQSRSQTLVPSNSTFPQAGFTAPLTSPISARTFVASTVSQANNLLFVNNRGTAFTRPVVVMYGAFSNLTIQNLTNGMQLNWSSVLLDGDYLVFDCARRTLVNSAGTNMLQFFTSSSSAWMWLEPSWNDIYVGGSGYSGNTKVVVFSYGNWK